MKTLSLALLATLLGSASFAQTTYTSPSTGSGPLSAYTTWTQSGSGTPVNVIVSNGYTVTNNGNTNITENIALVINGGGLMTLANNVTLSMTSNSSLQLMTNTAIVRTSTGNCVIQVGGNILNLSNGDKTGPASAYSGSGGWTSSSALPVTWGEVSVIAGNNHNTVKWSTVSEIDNSHFIIERAGLDGQFNAIAQVAGNGNSQAVIQYSYTDYDKTSGKTFYRIKQVDFNGNFEYSITVATTKEVANKITTLSPNVVNLSNNVVRINTHDENIKQITLIDMSGKVIEQSIPTANTNNMAFEIANIANLKSGIYSILVETQSTTKPFKLIVK